MENHKPHSISTKTNVAIWVSLVILTLLSVEASYAEFRVFAVVVALFIATAKSLIVAAYFMHLKFDSKLITFMILITLVVFSTFIILTCIDYGFR